LRWQRRSARREARQALPETGAIAHREVSTGEKILEQSKRVRRLTCLSGLGRGQHGLHMAKCWLRRSSYSNFSSHESMWVDFVA